ncbi:MAG TPA: PAC2 family protein [Actinomycetota bacterium]|nr:PAC2 family protein [Actinomycetota bacterium]
MEVVAYQSRPSLRRPVLIAAFRGWTDAADAASLALGFLRKHFGASAYASIDPEEFFDFTVQRPHVVLEDGITRRIEWPTTSFFHAEMPGTGRDAVLLSGIEPSTKWRTFCDSVIDVARASGTEMVITLGALLSDVPHSRPVKVTGTAYEPDLARRLGFAQSTYEGPAGILSVLHHACGMASIPSASLWAQVPYYVQANPSPKAALELIRRLSRLLSFQADTSELEEDTRTYEKKVAEAVEADPDVVAQVAELERASDAEPKEIPSGDELAAEFEQYLKHLKDDE